MNLDKEMKLNTLIGLITKEIDEVMHGEYDYIVSKDDKIDSFRYNQLMHMQYMDDMNYIIYLEQLKSELQFELDKGGDDNE